MKNRKCIKILLNITRQKWVMYKFNCWLNLCIKFMYKNFNCRIVFAQVTPNLKIIRRLAQVTPARGYLSEAGFLDFWPGNIFRIFYQIPLPGVQTQTHILIFFSDWNKIVFMKFFRVKVENPLKLPQFTVSIQNIACAKFDFNTLKASREKLYKTISPEVKYVYTLEGS